MFITLEALFSSPGETSFKIAFRAALFLGTDEEEYENILKFIQPLYALRNDILHGKKLVDEQDLFQLEEFEKSLHNVLLNLSKRIAADGEGASKFITVNVNNSKTLEEAKTIAFSIARQSAICKVQFAKFNFKG